MVNDNGKLTFFGDMQKDFTSIINTIHNHPYIDSLEKKQIGKDKLEIFICEQYKIIANDKRNIKIVLQGSIE